MGWAIAEGMRDPPNPVSGTRRPQGPAERDRVLTRDELAALWNVTGGDTDGDRIIRLMMLTLTRESEIGGMVRDELDLDTGLWTLPAARAKNHKKLELTLPKEALDIVRAIPRRLGRDHLFGKRGEGGQNYQGQLVVFARTVLLGTLTTLTRC